MSEKIQRELLARQAVVTDALHLEANTSHAVDRCFQMPRSIYSITVALYLGFFVVTGIGFASPGLIIPMAIFVVFVVAGFGLPAIWTRLAPDSGQRSLTDEQFRLGGITTATGPISARDAMVQVLILPALMFWWGLVVVAIAAMA